MRKLIFDVFVLTYFSLSTLFHCAYAQEAKSAEPDKNQTGAQVGTPTDQTTAPVPKINGTLSSENRPASILDVAACAPNYPAEAVKNEWEGRVVIGFSIDSAGFVTDSKILKSSGKKVLDEAARSSLSKCRFRPALSSGMPISTWTQVSWVWKLD